MFRKIFGKGKTDSNHSENTLSSGVKSTILTFVGGIRAIPTMPANAQKAFEIATNPNAEARDFIEVIESDEALSARVLKIANSVYFDRGKKSETIEGCVNVIGINELRCLLNASSLAEVFPSKHPARAQFWANDIGTALIAKNLAQRFYPAKEGIAFLAGLMHDIGKLFLLQRASPEYEKVLQKSQSAEKSFCEVEEEAFAFNHTEVGQLIAEKWRFSPELIEVVRNHHRPWSDEDLNGAVPSLVAVIKAADTISHALGFGHPQGYSRVKNSHQEKLDEVWTILRIPPGEGKATLESFQRLFDTESNVYLGKGN